MDMTQAQEPVKKVEENPILRNLWGIDTVERDGQVVAGEVDKEQVEFLKTTTMID